MHDHAVHAQMRAEPPEHDPLGAAEKVMPGDHVARAAPAPDPEEQSERDADMLPVRKDGGAPAETGAGRCHVAKGLPPAPLPRAVPQGGPVHKVHAVALLKPKELGT